MKKWGILAIAALFSVGSFAQVNTEERDLEHRTPPTLEQKDKKKDKDVELKTPPTLQEKEKKDVELRSAPTLEEKDRTVPESKADQDLKSQEVISTETKDMSVKKDNRICCGKEKDDGFLRNLRGDKSVNDASKSKTKTKTETKSKVETETVEPTSMETELQPMDTKDAELRTDWKSAEIQGSELNEVDQNKAEMQIEDPGVAGGAIDNSLDSGVSTESDVYNHDTRMDATGRGHLDLEGESRDLDSEMNIDMNKDTELKDSGNRCPASDPSVEDDSNLPDSDQRMNEDLNSPKF